MFDRVLNKPMHLVVSDLINMLLLGDISRDYDEAKTEKRSLKAVAEIEG